MEQIVTRFRGLGIPLTGPYLAIYLSVLEQTKGFSPINSSTVIEQFVEGVLEKYNPQYAFRSEFDYRNQIDYLAAMAEKMCRQNAFSIDYHVFYDWTKEYFDHIEVEQDYKRIIEYFVQDKILELTGNKTNFKYNIFLSFFIAHQMQKDATFKNWILEFPRYLSYVNEIDIYCGLVRNEIEIIEYFGEEFKRHGAELDKLVEPLAWNEPLEKLSIPRVADQGEFAAKIAEQLTKREMSAEERDQTLDRGAKQDQVRPDLCRPDISDVVTSWILTLRAYSVALKNLENIPGADKQKHLKAVLEGWAKVVRYACLLFKFTIDTKMMKVGELTFRLSLPEHASTKLIRAIFIGIPTIVSHWLRSDLGTQKLEVQLKNDSIPETLTAQFLQKGLYADLKLRDYLGEIKKVHKDAMDSEFFLEALMVKMRDIFIRYGLTSEEETPFLNLVAEIGADAQGLKGEARSKKIESTMQDLRKRKVISQLATR